MRAPLVERAFAKINLTLRVRGRRDDGYHDLESLVAFADLADTLTLHPGPDATLEISGPFAAASGAVADNLVLKTLDALRERTPGLTAGRFSLDKNIPVAAGIGGGSADAAAALRLLARANGIGLDDTRLADVARAVGADVPVCLASRPCIMRGLGDRLSNSLDLPKLPALLVNPSVALATRDVFAKFSGSQSISKSLDKVPEAREAMIEFLKDYGNDLTQAATACLPVIAEVVAALHALPGVRLTRMSGSGPTCFALFTSAGEANAAAQDLRAKCRDWWIYQGVVG